MKARNAEADEKGLGGEGKGPERKAFMKECLSAKSSKTAPSGASQQSKMKSCNKDTGAQSLKGEERKKFMSACLSN
jgi:psiF repeat-containing protein